MKNPKAQCVIPGCQNMGSVICSAHWFALDMKIRKRWWEETDYGKKQPSQELLEAMKADYESKRANAPDGGPAPNG